MVFLTCASAHLLFLFTSVSTSATNRWFPRSLPCDVTKNGSAVLVDCSERELVQVPSGFPANATNISLTINHILTVHGHSFSGLSNLTEIDLRCNCMPVRLGPKDRVCTSAPRIHQEAFSGLPALTSLYLDGNQLKVIPQGLPGTLTMLSLEANSIFVLTKANLSDLTTLEAIYLGQNCYYRNPCNTSYQIEQGAFYGLKRLSILSLKDNNLTQVPEKLPSSLTQLYLYNNVIERIGQGDLAELPGLEVLDLSGNCPRCYNAPFPCQPCPSPGHIQIHLDAFRALNKLQILRLQSNSLKEVPSSWFKSTLNLKILDLSENFLLNEISTATFLNYLPKLVELDLSFNYELKLYARYLNLSKSFSKLQSLQSLRIRGYVFKDLEKQYLDPLLELRHLRLLDLGTNFIKVANLQLFTKFRTLDVINLSENKISPSSSEPLSGRCGGNGRDEEGEQEGDNAFHGWSEQIHYFRYDDYGRSCKVAAREYSPWLPRRPSRCGRYGSTLDLSRNNIFFVGPSLFRQLSFLRCLNLSGNALSQTFNGTEFGPLTALRYLDLSYNRVDLLHASAFGELRRLRVLDLSHNEHYFQMEGLTHRLGFIRNLTALDELRLNGNAIHSSADRVLSSVSLRALEFRGNRLDYMWRDGTERYHGLFGDLRGLRRLDLSANRLSFIPTAVFRHLPAGLRELRLADNRLRTLAWDGLRQLPALQLLDLGFNQLSSAPLELANYSRGLRTLLLPANRIGSLGPHFLRGTSALRRLDLSRNRLRNIRPSSFPEAAVRGLRELRLAGNRFLCTCDALWLVWWLNRTAVHIPRLATGLRCAEPQARRGHSLLLLDLASCELDRLAVGLYTASSGLVLGLLLLATARHLFAWDLRHGYHLCRAKLRGGYRRLPSQRRPREAYAAFVAYDTRDPWVSDWVLGELLTNLEQCGQRRLPLCLEERDWLPGQLVMDNLSRSIQQSRKTVFVLTELYASSGQFRTAFYLAYQRLLDEKLDVIVLVLLEKVWQRSRYLRLKRRLCRGSVLEWPLNPWAQPLFWQRLRSALEADNRMLHGKLFNEII
ncbi:toll-like receptor 7 [Mustelus asterias]